MTSATPSKSAFIQGLNLVWLLARRDMKTRYASSYGGFSWNIGVPLLNAVTTVLVFSILMSGRMGDRYGDVSFPLFFFVPFILWMLFNDVVSRSTAVLKEHSYLITKIAFPAWTLPLVPLISCLLTQLILIVVVAALFAFSGTMPNVMAIMLIPLWLICAVFSIGIAYLVAALSVYITDLVHAVPVLLNIFFWLTPILYPPSLVESSGRDFARGVMMTYNPMYYFVETSRQLTFVGGGIPWSIFIGLTILSLTSLIVGIAIFSRLKVGFADVV